MTLRDDVRWLREAADGLLVGWLPPRLPKWSTSEGEQLGWLVLLLWRKYYDASMERLAAQTEAARLAGDVDGLREANARLTDVLDADERAAAFDALSQANRPIGYYWIVDDNRLQLGYWDGNGWWSALWPGGYLTDGMGNRPLQVVSRQLRAPVLPPGATET